MCASSLNGFPSRHCDPIGKRVDMSWCYNLDPLCLFPQAYDYTQTFAREVGSSPVLLFVRSVVTWTIGRPSMEVKALNCQAHVFVIPAIDLRCCRGIPET